MRPDTLSKIGAILRELDWVNARHAVTGFGGDPITLHVDKTGLPFYDVLRLYGAIDLYVGVREDVCINDRGAHWKVSGRARKRRVSGRDVASFLAVWGPQNQASEFCERLRQSLISGCKIPSEKDPEKEIPSDLDPVLQSGIRGVSAADYDSMNSSSNPRCKAKARLSEALVAYAGRVRTEGVGEITFLPIFEGEIDLGKIVSPLRAWLSVPSPLCAQVLMLLSLKTALWSEGYEKRLTGVAYSKKTQKTSFNYSGVIRIDSTTIGQIDDGEFCGLLYRIFRRMLSASWKNKKATSMAPHCFAVAEWLMQPLPQALSQMITAQEFLMKTGSIPFLVTRDNVRKVFEMTYPEPKIDHNAVRLLAKASGSAIYALGPKDDQERKRQHWYNEVVALRNAPTKEAFRYRVLTLIEQGRAAGSWVEPFNPENLLDSMGENRPEFEKFRDCFRMYLIQESAPRARTIPDLDDDSADAEPLNGKEDEG
jgi:hypothetical protein